MRLKIASVLLLAGTVVGCANNPPPPPPPMAAAPEPMPAAAPPAPMAPMAGVYRGPGTASGSSACRNPRGMQNARVRGNVITVANARGAIGPDGSVSGRNISGTVNGNTADITVKRGVCEFHYTLTNNAAPRGMSSSSSMPMNNSSMPMGGSSMPMNTPE